MQKRTIVSQHLGKESKQIQIIQSLGLIICASRSNCNFSHAHSLI